MRTGGRTGRSARHRLAGRTSGAAGQKRLENRSDPDPSAEDVPTGQADCGCGPACALAAGGREDDRGRLAATVIGVAVGDHGTGRLAAFPFLTVPSPPAAARAAPIGSPGPRQRFARCSSEASSSSQLEMSWMWSRRRLRRSSSLMAAILVGTGSSGGPSVFRPGPSRAQQDLPRILDLVLSAALADLSPSLSYRYRHRAGPNTTRRQWATASRARFACLAPVFSPAD